MTFFCASILVRYEQDGSTIRSAKRPRSDDRSSRDDDSVQKGYRGAPGNNRPSKHEHDRRGHVHTHNDRSGRDDNTGGRSDYRRGGGGGARGNDHSSRNDRDQKGRGETETSEGKTKYRNRGQRSGRGR